MLQLDAPRSPRGSAADLDRRADARVSKGLSRSGPATLRGGRRLESKDILLVMPPGAWRLPRVKLVTVFRATACGGNRRSMRHTPCSTPPPVCRWP